MIPLERLIDAWNDFFHTPEQASALCVFRIVWGALLFLDGLLLLPGAARYFGPTGLIPAECHRKVFGASRLSLFRFLPETNASVFIVLLTHLISAASLAVGWHPRAAAAIAYLSLTSVHHRNPCVFHSGDSLMRLITFLLIFSRSGDSYSLDSYLANATAAPSSPWCLRLMQLQVSILYIRTVWWKLRGHKWLDGTAVYYPMRVAAYRRLSIPDRFLGRHVVAAATYGTLVLESALGVLIWVEQFRYPVLLAGTLFHMLLSILLKLQLFGATVIATYILFLNNNDVDYVINYITPSVWRYS